MMDFRRGNWQIHPVVSEISGEAGGENVEEFFAFTGETGFTWFNKFR
jgi:hypothetical protein